MRSTVRALTTLVGGALALAACASAPMIPRGSPVPLARSGGDTSRPLQAVPEPAPYAPIPPPPATVQPGARPASNVAGLPGWRDEDHVAALRAFQAGCGAAAEPALAGVCARARALGPIADSDARRFFEANFRAQSVPGDGLLTAYFSPVYEARATPEGPFTAPLRARPADLFIADLRDFDPGLSGRVTARLSDGALSPYPDRREIEAAPAPTALAWMRPEDLFFLQIQGSGVLTLPDGRRLKATYAADNGRPFTPIARAMIQDGLLPRDGASGDAIRTWLAEHRGAAAEAMMDRNPRYVFFSVHPDDDGEPPGAAGLPLTPGRAIAVDPTRHAYGELYWIDASAPTLAGAFKSYRRLVMALDTGSAIRGEVRADLYIGRGGEAGREAGRVRHTLRMTRLVPLAAPLDESDEAAPAP